MTDRQPGTTVVEEAKPPIKRSRVVSLVLLASAGAAAFGFAAIDHSQDEEDVRVYAGPSDCINAHVRSASDCQIEYDAARTLYPTAAPRYATLGECEAHHGAGHCVAGETVSETARGQYLPMMAGYLVGATAEQKLPPQPVFDHAPKNETQPAGHSTGFYGGYCTGSGTRIWTTGYGRSSVARMSSAALRGSSFGGFGGTGRSFSSHSSSSHGFFGG